MPDVVGRLRPPRLAGAPASPAVGELYYNTGNNTLYYWNGTAWAGAGVGASGPAGGDLTGNYPNPTVAIARGTTLPATPVDKQEFYYDIDPINGITWHLRYNAGITDSSKWQFVGGPSLILTPGAFTTLNDSAWHQIIATPALPAGQYVTWAIMTGNCGGAPGTWYVGVAITGSGIVTSGAASLVAGAWVTFGGIAASATATAGQTISSYYFSSAVSSGANAQVSLYVIPRRIG